MISSNRWSSEVKLTAVTHELDYYPSQIPKSKPTAKHSFRVVQRSGRKIPVYHEQEQQWFGQRILQLGSGSLVHADLYLEPPARFRHNERQAWGRMNVITRKIVQYMYQLLGNCQGKLETERRIGF
ncbi:hypothetical protein B0H13DRAFT_1864501 [Mycena leptocephala]|nr:hypothetical protein B0H13DRAFT_1864501 [Mycena leptocephala]